MNCAETHGKHYKQDKPLDTIKESTSPTFNEYNPQIITTRHLKSNIEWQPYIETSEHTFELTTVHSTNNLLSDESK